MLFSSGNSLKSVSILSGEGFDLGTENYRSFLYTFLIESDQNHLWPLIVVSG
jgi:hypothetical protein